RDPGRAGGELRTGDSASGSGSLANRTAIVTGGASGIGRAVALAYAREGARVVVAADVSSPDEHEALVKAALERFGALHIACNKRAEGDAELSVLPLLPTREHGLGVMARLRF
ncbi:MAG TPA: SDR family NAD(P)-dependent oxidoreductase, partial [Gemmatimonadota bacterium]|nr:SDR family NAD(P)-dependent oxidoreductase [Gemmatimonadota bacterium]